MNALQYLVDQLPGAKQVLVMPQGETKRSKQVTLKTLAAEHLARQKGTKKGTLKVAA